MDNFKIIKKEARIEKRTGEKNLYFAISFFVILSIISISYAAIQSHPASQISPGTFGLDVEIGNYTFPQNLYVNGSLRLIPITTPIEENGVIFYNASSNKFMCYENNEWKACLKGTINGSGTINYIPIWISSTELGNSIIYQSDQGIGINTISPLGTLSIAGSSGQLVLTANTDGGEFNIFTNASGTLAIYGSNANTLNLRLLDGNLLIDSGSVGIGITPTQKLHVNGSLLVENSTGSAIFFVNSSSGNIGIGTTAPSEKLTVAGNIAGDRLKIKGTDGNYFNVIHGAAIAPNQHIHFVADYVKQSGATDVSVFFGFNSEISTYRWYSKWTGTNTYLMAIDATTGNVGIGTTAPSEKLEVAGNIKFTGNYLKTNVLSQIVPIYIRGTGLNNNANRVLKIGSNTIYDTTGRGLRLTVLNKSDLSIALDATYDTYGNSTASDDLANALNGITKTQIGILTSYDAWENAVTDNLKNAFKRCGLYKALMTPTGSRRPYAAIFECSSTTTVGTAKAVEVLFSNDANAPFAEIRGWLIDGSFVASGDVPNALANNIGTTPVVLVNEAGNVGIGTTAPTQKLHVNGSLLVENSTGSAIFFVNSSSGNIGIGTTAPGAKLQVVGDIRFGDVITSGGLTFRKSAAKQYEFDITNEASAGHVLRIGLGGWGEDAVQIHRSIGALNAGETPQHQLGMANINTWFAAHGGNVGIGTTAPDRPLTIQGKGANHELLSFKNNTGTTKWHWNLLASGLNLAETGVADGRLFIKEGGNVGIGTTAPMNKLHVQGTGRTAIRVSGPTTSSGAAADFGWYLNFGDTPLNEGTANQVVGWGMSFRTDTWGVNQPGSLVLYRDTNWTETGSTGSELVIGFKPNKDTIFGGNVGIGTTAPNAKLDVNGQIKANYGEKLGWRHFAKWYSWDGSNLHYYWNRLYQLTDSEAHINFQVYAIQDVNYPPFGHYSVEIHKYNNGASYSISAIPISVNRHINNKPRIYVGLDTSGYVWVKVIVEWHSHVAFKTIYIEGATELDTISYQEADPTAFSVTDGESKKADSSFNVTHSALMYPYINHYGNVGIGTTSPAVKLHVYNASDTNIFRLQDSDGTCNANPESSSVSWSCSSDIRLKTNITEAKPILQKLTQLKIREYNVISSGERKTGVIGQEVQEVMPELVKEDENGYLMVTEPNTWQLIKAIQELDSLRKEQQKQIEELKAENEYLKERLNKLETKIASLVNDKN